MPFDQGCMCYYTYYLGGVSEKAFLRQCGLSREPNVGKLWVSLKHTFGRLLFHVRNIFFATQNMDH